MCSLNVMKLKQQFKYFYPFLCPLLSFVKGLLLFCYYFVLLYWQGWEESFKNVFKYSHLLPVRNVVSNIVLVSH